MYQVRQQPTTRNEKTLPVRGRVFTKRSEKKEGLVCNQRLLPLGASSGLFRPLREWQRARRPGKHGKETTLPRHHPWDYLVPPPSAATTVPSCGQWCLTGRIHEAWMVVLGQAGLTSHPEEVETRDTPVRVDGLLFLAVRHGEQLFFTDDQDAQLLGLGQLGAGILSGDHQIGLLAD